MYRIACSMVNCGWNEAHAAVLIRDERYPGGRALQARLLRNPADAYRWFHSTWLSAEAFVRANPTTKDRHDILAEIGAIADHAADRQDLFTGNQGPGLAAALNCLIWHARKSGSTRVKVSSREAAEFMQCGQPTAARALRTLHERKIFVNRVRVGRYSRSTYQLKNVAPPRKTDSVPPPGEVILIALGMHEVHPAFSRTALGPTPGRVYDVLVRASGGGADFSPQGENRHSSCERITEQR